MNQNLKDRILSANTAQEVLEMTQGLGLDLAAPVARLAQTQALEILRGAPVAVEILITDRKGEILVTKS